MKYKECAKCDKSFTDPPALDFHMKKEHNESELEKYERKQKIAESQENQKKLYAENINEKEQKVIQNQDDTLYQMEPITYMCSRIDCKKEFEVETEYDNHVEIEHKELPIEDKIALKETSELTAALDALQKENPAFLELQEEDVVEEKVNDLKDVIKEVFDCDKCNFKTNSNRNLRIHKRTTHDSIQTKCNQCSQVVNSNQNLLIHIKQTHGIKLLCDKCAFKTKSPMIMRQHKRRLHMPQIKCDECPMEFKTKTEVTTHKTNHKTGFKCEHCEFHAISRRAINTHINKDHVENNTPQRGTKRSKIQSPEVTKKVGVQTNPIEKRPKKENVTEAHKYKFPTKEKDVIGGAGYKTEEKKPNKPETNLETKTTPNRPLKFENLPNVVAFTLPEHKDSVLQIVLGDGACSMRCIAVHLDLNEDEGLEQSKAFNKHLVANRDIYEPSTKFPKTVTHSTKGGKVDITYEDNETGRNKYFEFLETEAAKHIWRESDEIRYLATFLNLEIEVVKILKNGKIEIPVQKYSPDEDFEQETVRKPKVTLLNTNDDHFNLILKHEMISHNLSPPPFLPQHHPRLVPAPPLSTHTHPVTSANPKIYQCDYCEKKEATSTTLELHTETEHSSDVIKKLKLQIEEMSNKHCHPKTFKEAKIPEKKQTKPKHNILENWRCDICSYNFTTSPLLEAHKRNKHDQPKTEFRFSQVFLCDTCGAVFKTTSELQGHKQAMHIDDIEMIDICDDQEEMEIVKLDDNTIGKFKCNVCNLVQDTKNKLETHMVNHDDDADWTCDGDPETREDCPFQINEKPLLISHVNESGHASKMLNISNVENVPFPTNQDTNNTPNEENTHIRIKCAFCNNTFNSKNQVARHRKDVHPSFKPCRNMNQCQFQSECFFSHEPIPEGEFRCYMCGDNFKTMSEMMIHRKNNHSEDLKPCKKFITNQCRNGSHCWWPHENQPSIFWQATENLAPPSQIWSTWNMNQPSTQQQPTNPNNLKLLRMLKKLEENLQQINQMITTTSQ